MVYYNIIDGVTKIINRHGKIIVIEEDIIVDKNFFEFLNQSLNFYKIKIDLAYFRWNYNLNMPLSFDGYFTKQ